MEMEEEPINVEASTDIFLDPSLQDKHILQEITKEDLTNDKEEEEEEWSENGNFFGSVFLIYTTEDPKREENKQKKSAKNH